VVIKAP